MALFDGFRRKRDEPVSEAAETQPDELEGDEDSVDGPGTWYRAMYEDVVQAGDDVLVHDPERHAPIVVPTFELSLLEQCTHFASIEAHSTAIANRAGLPADGVAHRLYELVDRGLLISQQQVMARACAAAADANAPPPPILDRVAVITGDRPATLANCLRSYRKRYGDDLELIIFDDSAEPTTRAENRRVALQAGGRILYAGEEEKRRFITDLAERSGVDPDVVRAAVSEFDGCASHTGANRNAALLDAAGGAVLMVDDDTTARATYLSDPDGGFRLSSRPDPLELRLFASVEDALNAAEWQDADLLASHRRFLGRSPAACACLPQTETVSVSPNTDRIEADLNEADAALISAFFRGRGRVVVTSAGVAGDSGMGPQVYLQTLRGAARQRLVEDYDSYRATRAVHRGADVATVSNTRFLMTPHVAFDVSVTIPPFSPVLRNEDAVFGGLLRTCSPEAYIAFLPWSVEHRPPVARDSDFDQILDSVGRVPANSIIRDLARSHEPGFGVTDPARRLRAFGQYLVGLGAMAPTDFDALVRYQIAVAIGGRIDRVAHAVNRENGEPEQWAEDCAALLAEGLRCLSNDALVVGDMPGDTADERNRRFQRLVYRFGRVIDAWPTLLDAATGLRLAEPLNQ